MCSAKIYTYVYDSSSEESGKMSLYMNSNRVNMQGKTVAITGANSGIGRATAMELSRRGARILMLCRNRPKAEQVMREIKETTGNDIALYQVNLASLNDIRRASKEIRDRETQIDVLINNAGVMMCPDWKTVDGFEMQFGTNHLGHFLLTELLMPLLKKAREVGNKPRIIIVSSVAHELGTIRWDDINWKRSYDPIGAYSMSKLANVMHGIELSRRVKDFGISVYILHPGVINTDLLRHQRRKWYGFLVPLMSHFFFKTPLEGCQTVLFCAMDEGISDQSGKYYSDCREKSPSCKALDVLEQRRLWELSEAVVGLKDIEMKNQDVNYDEVNE